MNNKNNMILIDSLESSHHREFGLQSSQQRVVLASHYHERLTKNKGGMKRKKNGLKLRRNALSSCWFLLVEEDWSFVSRFQQRVKKS